jgi:hypothetical protein
VIASAALFAAGLTVIFALFRDSRRALQDDDRGVTHRNRIAYATDVAPDDFAAIFSASPGPTTVHLTESVQPKVLILTPVKNSAHHLLRFFKNVRSLSYPRDRISIGMLESDSDDVISTPVWEQLKSLAPSSPVLGAILKRHEELHRPQTIALPLPAVNVTTGSALRGHVHGRGLAEGSRLTGTLAIILAELPALKSEFRRVSVFQHDFGLSLSRQERHTQMKQMVRRSVLARSRNHLLMSALRDEDFVLWVDSDLQSYPADVIQQLVSSGKKIVTPHCVMETGGRSYDLNSWRVRDEKLGVCSLQ